MNGKSTGPRCRCSPNACPVDTSMLGERSISFISFRVDRRRCCNLRGSQPISLEAFRISMALFSGPEKIFVASRARKSICYRNLNPHAMITICYSHLLTRKEIVISFLNYEIGWTMCDRVIMSRFELHPFALNIHMICISVL